MFLERILQTEAFWKDLWNLYTDKSVHVQCIHYMSWSTVLLIITAKLPGLSSTEREAAVSDMELVITYYCKTRNIRFSTDAGWPELFVPMLALGMNKADLFNCFYTLMTKYIPR